jgi:hypothetical protein
MTLYRVLFYAPGHFHAALTLQMPSPRFAPDIRVYATSGPEALRERLRLRDTLLTRAHDLARREGAVAQGPVHGP